MRKLVIALLGLAFLLPTIGCEKNEVRIERRETIKTQSPATPIVVPDAPAD